MTGQFAVRQSQRGVTIVELMVAMTLGLVAIGGAAAIYLANRQSFATVQGVARIEEGARFAADLLARDIREAGNSVCGGAMSSSNLVTSPIPNWAAWDRGLLGNALADTDVVATSVAGPAAPATRDPNSDSLLVWSASRCVLPPTRQGLPEPSPQPPHMALPQVRWWWLVIASNCSRLKFKAPALRRWATAAARR